MTTVVRDLPSWIRRPGGVLGLAAAIALPLLLLRTGPAAGWWAAGLAVGLPAALLAMRWPELTWWAAIAAAPLSVELPIGIGGARVAVPSEPLMVLAILAWAARWRRDGPPSPPPPWSHPVVLLGGATLVWTAVSSVLGTAPGVGLKLAAVRSLQAVVCLGLGVAVLTRPDRLRRLARVAGFALLPLVALVLVRLAVAGFEPTRVFTSAQPFFANRLELGVLAAFWLLAGTGGPGPGESRAVWLASLVGPAVAVTLLHARAGWLCLGVGLVVRTLVVLRPRPAAVAAVAVTATVALGALVFDGARWWDARASSPRAIGPLDPLWISLTTSATDRDQSVLERMNRWRCALVMAAHRPLAGFGPGTFEGVYGTFQRATDLTPVSTFTGDRGDAHSQPLGTLAEQGLVGLAMELALLAAGLASGLRAAWRARSPEHLAAAAAWSAALAGLTAAGLFVGWSDLSATGPAAWLALAALVRLDRGDAP